MTKTKSTKRALLSSVMALFLCFTMLLGTTYAWFTDSVTSGGNIIKSGTLDIEFDKWNGTEWVDASAEPIFNYDKWEPGYTQVVNLRVVNVGTLALKWQAAITTEDELSELADVINVYVRSDDRSDTVRDYIEAVTDRAEFDTLAEEGQFKKFTLRDFIDNLTVMTQGTLEPAQESYLGIVLQMDTAAGNTYQGLDLGGEFDLTILATQLSSESDSFGDDYDLYATYDALKKDGNVYSLVSDVTITNDVLYQSTVATEAVTINGNGHTVTGAVTSVDEFTWSNNGTIPDLSNIFSSGDKSGALVTVNDLTFTGTMSAITAGNYVNSSSNWFNTEFNNVNIIDAEVVSFSAGIAPALCIYGNMTMNNCVVTGTELSALDTDGYTAYDVAVVNYSDTVINNSKIGSLYMWNQAKVTVAEGSEVETIVIRGNMNATKYGLTVKAGATVGVIDLTNITNVARVNITIEDGATVSAIVDNGVEYASIDAWKAAQ